MFFLKLMLCVIAGCYLNLFERLRCALNQGIIPHILLKIKMQWKN